MQISEQMIKDFLIFNRKQFFKILSILNWISNWRWQKKLLWS